MTRKSCPLHPAEDAIIIDTTSMSINEVASRIESMVKDA